MDQRIKRIVNALQQIEKVVFDLYMTTGLSMKAMEEHPEKDAEEILQTSRERASKLKGPQSDTSQADVDDLLSQRSRSEELLVESVTGSGLLY